MAIGGTAMTYKKIVGQIRSVIPGLRNETSLSGVVIDVSVSGTTSVSTGSMSELALMRFDELKKQDQIAPDLKARVG